jgi:hypothetical protein
MKRVLKFNVGATQLLANFYFNTFFRYVSAAFVVVFLRRGERWKSY